MNFTNMFLAGDATGKQPGGVFDWFGFIWIALLLVAMYFLMIRPQKKKQKQEEQLRKSIQVGDEIVTIGGFYGRVMSVKDEELVIESVADKSKQRIAVWAVQQNLTVHDDTKK